MLPDEAEWLSPEASKERYPHGPCTFWFDVWSGVAVLSDLGAYVKHLDIGCPERQGVDLANHKHALTEWGEYCRQPRTSL